MHSLTRLQGVARPFAATLAFFLAVIPGHMQTISAAGIAPRDAAPANAARSVTVEPLSGPVGTQVTVGGTGFNANTTITLKFNGDETAVPPALTGASGNFTLKFTVPPSSSGDHTIEISDGTNVASQNFVVIPAAEINPQSGYAGTKISVSGSGFLANGTASISFDNISVQKATIGTNGNFASFFDAPARLSGTYMVRIVDGKNSRELGFAVITSVSMNPVTSPTAPGFVGQQVTVGGVGFVPGSALTINYDGQQIAAGTVNSDSNFSTAFIVPKSKAGQHTVTVGDGINIIPLKFYMEFTPPAAPTLTRPAVGTSEKAQPTFAWSAVGDPSGVSYQLQIGTTPNFDPGSVVLDKAGLKTTAYALSPEEKLKPLKRTKAYFWRVDAEDGASNIGTWSNTSYFAVGTPSPAWVVWMFVGLGAVIIVLFGFWLGRRSSSRPAAKPGAGGQK